MGAIPFISAGAFEPNEIESMSLACEQICDALHINCSAEARETIAARVIELTRRGERCPTALRERVLAEANGGTLRLGLVAWSRQLPAPSSRTAAAQGRRFANSNSSTAASPSVDNTT